MDEAAKRPETIDEYIESRPQEVRPFLRTLCGAIRAAAPGTGEKISWGMATFTCHGNLVHFSAETRHAGFHPAPSAIEAFREQLTGLSCSKGTVRLPYDRPLPLDLIKDMVRFRVAEQEAHGAAGRTGRAAPEPREARLRCPMPEDVRAALEREGLSGRYEARPPYQQNDYLSWIASAKRAGTREKRLLQMLEELRSGDAYRSMPYRAKRPDEA